MYIFKNKTEKSLAHLPYGYLSMAFAIIISFLSMVLPQMLVEFFFKGGAILGDFTPIFYNFLTIILCVLTAAIIFKRFDKRDLGFELINYKKSVIIAISFAIAFNVFLLVAERFDSSLSKSSLEVIKSMGFGKSLKSDLILCFAILSIAPLWEEVVYRGLALRAVRDGLYSKFKNIIPTIISILVSSYLFISAHGGEGQDSQIIYLFLLAVLLSLSYLMSSTLLAPVILHSLNNTYALLSIFLKADLKLFGGVSPFIFLLGPFITFILFALISKIYDLNKLSS